MSISDPAPSATRSSVLGRRGSSPVRRAVIAALAALITVPAAALSASPATAASTLNPAQFHGVNWASPGDNFQTGIELPEGLSASDDYNTVVAKANAVYDGFQSTLGANIVRLPINNPTAGPGSTWWGTYRGAIDAATARGMKVLLTFWDDSSVGANGAVTNMDGWNAMWDNVTSTYKNNSLVYYEPYNEPHGYSTASWANVATAWVSRHSDIAPDHIFISGGGYNGDVNGLCNVPGLAGTYLTYHHYGWAATNDYNGWAADFDSRINGCSSRVVVDEFGAPMDDGRNYNDSTSTDNFVQYLRADTDSIASMGLGAIYWPALGGKHADRPTYDWYSLYSVQGSGTNLTLGTRNVTGLDRLRHAFGTESTDTSSLKNLGTNGLCLDIPGATQNNVQVQGYTCNGTIAQQWTRTASGQITAFGGTKCLDAYQNTGSAHDGTVVGTYTCSGGVNQQWTFYSDGTIHSVQAPSLCIDLDIASSKVQLWTCYASSNQKWQTV